MSKIRMTKQVRLHPCMLVLTRPESTRIGYVTDIEGNLDYWQRYKRISSVFENINGRLSLKPRCSFVFGGRISERM